MSLLRSLCSKLSNISPFSSNNLIKSTATSSYFSGRLNSNIAQVSSIPLQGEASVCKEERQITKDVIKSVNEVQKTAPCRTFAVVQICGKQFKVTPGDVVIIEGYWPPTIGDKLRLDKVLLAGSKDFSLIGAPLVQPGLVNVNATVIEKTLSHIKTHFRKKRRKQYMRINFYRGERTALRINDVKIGQLDEDI